MSEMILNSEVDKLELGQGICSKLRNCEIYTIGDLCSHTRGELKKLDLPQKDIQYIIIRLQLNGLDIKNNYKY